MQLEMEAQQKKDALDKLQSTEQRAAQLELDLQMEAEQKVKALEQVEILGGRLADIGSQNEDQSKTQMKKEFAETIHLCESLSTEKDMLLAERDYLKQELGMFIEQIEILEKEKAALSQELEEKREGDEFKALEDECRKDHERWLAEDKYKPWLRRGSTPRIASCKVCKKDFQLFTMRESALTSQMKELLLSASSARQKYHMYLDDQRRQKLDEKKTQKRKGLMEEITRIKAKKKRMEENIRVFMKSADHNAEKAESQGKLSFISKSNRLRRAAKEKERHLETLER
ncbi:hypothetical protein NQZ68_008418 [Dissostichus eleginoides]|nr:hypothetical protein NQZ68_008418 [Dissostichus eleginoides]